MHIHTVLSRVLRHVSFSLNASYNFARVQVYITLADVLQVAAAARERANIAEQRLVQRAEMMQERQQHAADLMQVSLVPSEQFYEGSTCLCVEHHRKFFSFLPKPNLRACWVPMY